MNSYIITSNDSTVWERIDGCKKQYRCTLSVYLMTTVLLTFKISIDKEIGVPGHCKYAV